MNKLIPAALAAAAVAIGAFYMTRPPQTPAGPVETASPGMGDPLVSIALPDSLSAEAALGQRAFEATCAACHGVNATGKMGFGPPLVHKIYEPSHHADIAFQMAVQNGVRAHHWRFGDMPPQEGLTPADVANVVAYVRALQRANGIE
ncbi:c-type cytochrome [Pseudooceanicola nanhaiensis]|uniref:c-type cytochrome n=1 Tax=Pseudooceanicola nanhaiensis TaxID=375761 RepID=UPI001CD4E550|nr:cytochrome c [Pseudooceanicola nanhaiensis]MCA0920660.1 c-type cytochrome [Pseudooceanicola nanhaiensis]